MKNYFFICLIGALLLTSCSQKRGTQVDVLIIGGGASGVSAGIQASRMGVNTLIIEESDWLGGMLTAAGVCAIDGNYKLPAGVWGEFMHRLAEHYGGLDSLKTGWVSNVLFEPSVGNSIFHQMVTEQLSLQVWKKSSLQSLQKKGDTWQAVIVDDAQQEKTVLAKIVIDATELGDVAKLCGVPYDIGWKVVTIHKRI